MDHLRQYEDEENEEEEEKEDFEEGTGGLKGGVAYDVVKREVEAENEDDEET